MKKKKKQHNHRGIGRRAFSLIEAMLLVVMLGIVAAASALSIKSVNSSARSNDVDLAYETALVDKMEAIKALSFDSLAVGSPSSLSDTVTINGTSYNRTVNVSLADPEGGTSYQGSFKLVEILCNGKSLRTLVCKP